MEDLKSKYADLHVSIKEYCDKKDLEFEWKTLSFPIIGRIYYKREDDGQLNMGKTFEDIKPLGKVEFIFGQELVIKIDDEFEMPEEVLNKLKNNIKKLHYLFLQVYFETKEGGSHELGKGSY